MVLSNRQFEAYNWKNKNKSEDKPQEFNPARTPLPSNLNRELRMPFVSIALRKSVWHLPARGMIKRKTWKKIRSRTDCEELCSFLVVFFPSTWDTISDSSNKRDDILRSLKLGKSFLKSSIVIIKNVFNLFVFSELKNIQNCHVCPKFKPIFLLKNYFL